MNFAFTEEQAMVADTARAFFAEHATSERTRAAMARPDGVDWELWRAFTELGLTGIAIPESHGGSGLGMVELAIVCEAAGAWVAALPLIATLGLAAPALIAGGSEAQKERWLPRIAGGMAAAFGDGPLAAHGLAAELLLSAEGERVRLGTRDRAWIEPLETMDQTRPLARVSISGDEELSSVALAAARRVGAVAVAADALGGAQACLNRTVAFASERVQFGRPIGSFQAVKHQLADVMVAIEQARSAVYWAACAIDEDSADRDIAVHSAKAAACDAYTQAAAAMVQLHGGIGFTWEHDAHLFFKRARADATLMGTPDWHRARIAELVLDEAA